MDSANKERARDPGFKRIGEDAATVRFTFMEPLSPDSFKKHYNIPSPL